MRNQPERHRTGRDDSPENVFFNVEPADVEPARFGEPPPTEADPVYAKPLDRATETGLPPEIVEAAAEACICATELRISGDFEWAHRTIRSIST